MNTEFKHRITTVLVTKSGFVNAFDQQNEMILYFSGIQHDIMPRIKRRIEKQMPCSILWKVEEGANFSDFGSKIVHYQTSKTKEITESK